MPLSLFSLGPLWTKRPAAGLLPPSIETYPGWENFNYTSPITGQGLLSRAQQLSFLCRSGGISSSLIYVSSDDGETWTTVTMPANMKWLYVAWTGVMYVAFTAGTTTGADKFAYSKDGYSWTLTAGTFSNFFRRIGTQTNGQGGYIIPNFSSPTYMYTLDGGFTWTTASTPHNPGGGAFFHYAADGQRVVIGVVNFASSIYIRSINSGVTFNLTTFPASMLADGNPIKVAWDSGVFWVQCTSTIFWVSDDGSNWVRVVIPTAVASSYSFARGILDPGPGSAFYNAKRSSTTDINIPTAPSIYGLPTTDSPLARDLNSETIFGYDATLGYTFSSSKLTAHRNTPVTLAGGGLDVGNADVMASNGSNLLVALKNFISPFGTTSYTSTNDGVTWTAHSSVFPNNNAAGVFWRDLVWDGTHFIALADDSSKPSAKHYYSTNGVTWTEGTNVLTGYIGIPSRMTPRVGGGVIMLPTPATGGGLPFILPSPSGSWYRALDPLSTFNTSSFNGWTSIAGDGDGNYVIVRSGTSTPNNPAVGYSTDNGENWNYYELTGGVYTDTSFVSVCWDGNQWLISATRPGFLSNIFASDVMPTSPSDWSYVYSRTTNTAGPLVTQGNGQTLMLSSIYLETVEGTKWSFRDLIGQSGATSRLSAMLGQRAGVRSRLDIRTRSGSTNRHHWNDIAMYPHITFGETAAGTLTGRAVSRRAEFTAELASLSLSVASHDIESLTVGSITPGAPRDLTFATSPPVHSKLRAVTSASVSNLTGSTFNTSISGSKYLLTNGSIVIDFPIPIDAVGFYITNAPRYSVTGSGNVHDRVSVTVTTALGLSQTYRVPVFDLATRVGTLAFWGIVDIDRKIVSIRIKPDNPAAASYGIDDIIVGVNTATAVNYDPTLSADFIATPTSGNAPLIPQFEDRSGPLIPVAWWWDFNDDGFYEKLDREYTPKSSFFEGTYNVRLMVKWTTGQFGTVVKPAYISSSAVLPAANFTAGTLSGVAPLSVTFTDTTTNFPTSWAWDFDNSGSVDSTLQNPTHVYSTAGTYSVRLTATNGAGSNSLTRTAYVTATQPAPVASFTASTTAGPMPLSVTFTDTSTNSPTSWAWDFDNSGSVDSTSQNPTYVFTTAGTYTVKLTATNSGGSNTATVTNYITVSAGGSIPMMTFDHGFTLGDQPVDYYNGGVSNNGVGPGPAYGVVWYAPYVQFPPGAASAPAIVGTSYEGEVFMMNYATGFTGDIEFMCMITAGTTISVKCWSGTYGTGTLLGSVTGSYGNISTGTMVPVTVSHTGLCKSVTWESPSFDAHIYIDNVVVNL